MHRTTWKIASLSLIVVLAVLGRVEAQQDHQQHHPEGTPPTQQQMGEATPGAPTPAPMGQPMQGMMQQMQGMMQQMQGMMQQMHSQMGGGVMGRGGMIERGQMGEQDDDDSPDDDDMLGRGMRMGRGMMGRGRMMMGHGGMMRHMQHMLARLTEGLDLSDEQQAQAQALWRAYAKEAIRLKANIATAHLDLQQLLDTQPIDMDGAKTALQTIAGKEAELRLGHIAAMQDIRKLLTPEQQKKFRGMMGHGGMMGRGGMMGHGAMMGGKSRH